MKLDMVFSGIGGQGIVVLSDIFCEAALLDGFDVAKAEVHGMAQRGGSIVAYARIGDKVEAPLIERGKADVILGFEILETARVLPMLKKGGTVVVNTKYIPPNCAVQGAGIAEKVGNPIVVNTVLLGALSALPENPIKKEMLEKAICSRLKPKFHGVNLQAFQLGRESVLLG
jgi:indolepyruvate ferredoxin oxidoreductase beta subunit